MATEPNTALADLFAEDAAPPLDIAHAPTDGALKQIARAARELHATDARLKRAQALVEQIQRRQTHLSTKVLPELCDQAGTDNIGLAELNCDVVVAPHYHAAIRADWPAEKRQAAFDHLELMDAGALVRTELTVTFTKEEYHIARKLQAAVVQWLAKAKVETTPRLDMAVHWGTLTNWMREKLETPLDPHAPPSNRPPFVPALIGGAVYRMAKVVTRQPAPVKRTNRKKRGA